MCTCNWNVSSNVMKSVTFWLVRFLQSHLIFAPGQNKLHKQFLHASVFRAKNKVKRRFTNREKKKKYIYILFLKWVRDNRGKNQHATICALCILKFMTKRQKWDKIFELKYRKEIMCNAWSVETVILVWTQLNTDCFRFNRLFRRKKQ